MISERIRPVREQLGEMVEELLAYAVPDGRFVDRSYI
jgi:hypothetical protein